jgi:protein-S-isoprenylcysteine O-methyltransferase Ste14
MWIARIILAVILFAMIGVFGLFLKRRRENAGLLENRPANLLGVVFYNLACYAMAGLPSDPNVFTAPAFLAGSGVRTGFLIVGLALIVFSSGVLLAVVRQRKTVGGENVKEGLLTSGIYHYARHPIYAGIVGTSLGIALAFGTWDGMLMFPVIALLNLAEAWIEERYDIGARFPDEYREYRKRTRMFGPFWFWGNLAGILVIIAGAAYLK